ncbi:MAG TPA: RagB/SusD family nutrient uptake outer membrane protein [Sphingobacteriaceae bacterium]
MKRLYNKLWILFGAVSLLAMGCTDLDEELYGSRYVDTSSTASSSDLNSVYAQLNGFADQANTGYSMQEHTTDEQMGPTRGTDWDDFGVFRELHLHTWDASHSQIYDTWNNLNIGVYRATLVADRGADNQIKGEARFLRAWFMYNIVDLFGKAPFRNPDDAPDVNPQVLSRTEATNFIIEDLKFAEANLTVPGTAGKASREAAEFLLAKVYLNRAVFNQDPQSPAGPFTFAKSDMDSVIFYANAVINTGKYQLDPSYFDNFKWDNSTASSELIFVRENSDAEQPANTRNRTYMGNHYNQTPSGWNGFTTLADFYNSFEDGDQRKGGPLPGFTDRLGQWAGFNIGQQYGPGNVPLQDRSGNPLIFTPEVNLSYATESQGIRVTKYPLDPDHLDNSANDYVFFRYADLLLMKAEALLRGGGPDPMGQTPQAIVNSLRTIRGASQIGAVDETVMLAERGRELYYEGWRRNDLVRFGKFNDPTDQRPQASAPTRVVFPIPQRAVDTNPNLEQNPGY